MSSMADTTKGREREREIITFFYLIFGRRVHLGMSPEDARKEAYDAVALRYGIGRGRLLNIISNKRNVQTDNDLTFKAKAHALIDALSVMNQGLDSAKEKNEKLIALLKECTEDDFR